MTATANGPLSSRAAAGPGPAGTGDGVVAQLSTLLRALGRSDFRRRLYLLAAGMVVVVCCNAAGQVMLNRWQRAFYDAIERRDVPDFVRPARRLRGHRRRPAGAGRGPDLAAGDDQGPGCASG